MSKRSRLYRKLENENKKNFILSLIGTVILLFLLIKFGPPLLVNLSLFLSGTKQGSVPVRTSPDFIMPPQLNSLPSATNSAKFTLTGKSDPDLSIDFYLNGSLSDKTQADKNGNFSFDSQFIKGQNSIYTVARKDSKKSSPSETLVVLFKDTKPNLTLSSPTDGQQFSKDQNEISVSGSTDANVKITINGFRAIVDQSNNFSYKLKLQSGDNTIKVVAEDEAGNRIEKQITVKYSST